MSKQEIADQAKEAFAMLHDAIDRARDLDDLSKSEKGFVSRAEAQINNLHAALNREIAKQPDVSVFFGDK